MNETHIAELRNEINHLKNLLDCKGNEIRRLYEENTKAKKALTAEIELQQKTNEGKKRVYELRVAELIELYAVPDGDLGNAEPMKRANGEVQEWRRRGAGIFENLALDAVVDDLLGQIDALAKDSGFNGVNP